MPELPEVEAFRWGLLPLKSSTHLLLLKRIREDPPRNFISDDQIAALNNNCFVEDVERKGKQIMMTLNCAEPVDLGGRKHKKCYLILHMGMTGRISSPGNIPALESTTASDEYPPPHTHLTFSTVDSGQNVIEEACFSDPRKFGSVEVARDKSAFEDLAPDGLTLEENGEVEKVVDGLAGQSKPIKAILLDQKKVVSGVGNWVADEIMYQCKMHPEQKYLTSEEAKLVVSTMISILRCAVDCLRCKKEFPDYWLFAYRWTKQRSDAKDFEGRTINFIKAGGRTSAIVPSAQKLKGGEKSARSKVGSKAVKGKTEETRENATKRLPPASTQNGNDSSQDERPKRRRNQKNNAASESNNGRGEEGAERRKAQGARNGQETVKPPPTRRKRSSNQQSSVDTGDGGGEGKEVLQRNGAKRRTKRSAEEEDQKGVKKKEVLAKPRKSARKSNAAS